MNVRKGWCITTHNINITLIHTLAIIPARPPQTMRLVISAAPCAAVDVTVSSFEGLILDEAAMIHQHYGTYARVMNFNLCYVCVCIFLT